MNTPRHITERLRCQRGLTLLETLIASFLLLIVLLSMITAYAFGRLDLEREEVKRKATGVMQNRIETVRSRYASKRPVNSQGAWDDIAKAKIDTTVVVDGRTYTVVSTVTTDDQNNQRLKRIDIDVNWTAKTNNNASVARKVHGSTSIAKITGPPVP